MITNLREVDAQIEAGREIEVVKYNTRNYRNHLVLEQLSRLLAFMLECDSNNTSSKNLPSDTRDIRDQFKIVKDEFEFGMQNNDAPTGSHEYAYHILLPSGKEIQRIRNVKIKRVLVELFNLCRVVLSVDSSNSQGYVSVGDANKIRAVFDICDKCMDRWIGDGSDDANLGLEAPAYEKLGQMIPDVDGDYAQLLEPSLDLPKPKLPDVPDKPSQSVPRA